MEREPGLLVDGLQVYLGMLTRSQEGQTHRQSLRALRRRLLAPRRHRDEERVESTRS